MIKLAKNEVLSRHPDPFSADVVSAAKAHALSAYPQESCGIVVDGRYIPADNVHPDPLNNFTVDPNTSVIAACRGAQAIVHSHPDSHPHPSYEDQVSQIASGLIWGIVPVMGINQLDTVQPVASDIVWWGDPLPVPPLKKRKFIWGVFHCYQLYRDWHRIHRGVVIPNFACDYNFVDNDVDIFLGNVTQAGLTDLGKIELCDLQEGDMLVGKLRGNYPNHCMIYEGGDTALHHPPGAISGDVSLLRWWPFVDSVFRHERP